MSKTQTTGDGCVVRGVVGIRLCMLGALLVMNTASVTHLWGQTGTASVLGTVTDSTGAAIPGANVQAKNTGTGSVQTTASDSQGRFRIPELGIGTYDIQATKMGFSTVVHDQVTLNVGSEVVIDFTMPVGQQSQTVTVEGQVSQVETTSSAVATLTDQRQMRELPLNGRNFEQLILLAPASTRSAPSRPPAFKVELLSFQWRDPGRRAKPCCSTTRACRIFGIRAWVP